MGISDNQKERKSKIVRHTDLEVYERAFSAAICRFVRQPVE
jgi:hypothetical protein